jgi:hypothetical protein
MKKALRLFLLKALLATSIIMHSGIFVDRGDVIVRVYIDKKLLTTKIRDSTPMAMDTIELISNYACSEDGRMEVAEPYKPHAVLTDWQLEDLNRAGILFPRKTNQTSKKGFMSWLHSKKFIQCFKRKKK